MFNWANEGEITVYFWFPNSSSDSDSRKVSTKQARPVAPPSWACSDLSNEVIEVHYFMQNLYRHIREEP